MRKYETTIVNVENGYLVAVGCKNFVFEKKEDMLKELDAYLSDQPTKLTEKYKNEEMQETCVQETPTIVGAVDKILKR